MTLVHIRCETCGADVALEEHLRTAECPYCASSSVVERPPSRDRPRPTFGLGFVVDHERAVAIARSWLRSRGPFAHSGLGSALVERTRGIYLPAWLYGARGSARWHARIGEDYTVTETYTTTDSKGNAVTRTRTRIETEWSELGGAWETYLMDVVVTASRGLNNDELEQVEPFDLRALRRYTPELIAGWIAEDPTLSRAACMEQARAEATEEVTGRLQGFMPGDRYTDLTFKVQFEDEVADLALLPIWVFSVRYHPEKPPVRLLINGQTGQTAGRVPLSRPKITAAVVLGLVGLLLLLRIGGLL
jgi:DNA-directed RNA polymerase subunit RPC12/RpoP